MRANIAWGVAVSLALGACSSFNMLPACDQTTVGLAQTIFTSNGEPLDEARLARLVSFSTPQEIGAAYNQRTCKIDATAFGETTSITYTVRQSEGIKGWAEFTLPNDPATTSVIAKLRDAYAI